MLLRLNQSLRLAGWFASKALNVFNAKYTVQALTAFNAKSIVKAGWLADWLAGKALKGLTAKSVIKAGWLTGPCRPVRQNQPLRPCRPLLARPLKPSIVNALKTIKAKSVVKAGWLPGWQGP